MLELQHVTDLSGRETLVRITGMQCLPITVKIDSGITFGLIFLVIPLVSWSCTWFLVDDFHVFYDRPPL